MLERGKLWRAARANLLFGFSLACALATFFGGVGEVYAQGQKARIGVVVDGSSDFYKKLGEQFRKEVTSLAADEFEIVVEDEDIIFCDFTQSCINDGLDKLLEKNELQLIVAQGFIGSNLLLQRKSLERPALAPFVIDPRAQGIDPEKTPKNLSYLLWSINLSRDLEVLDQLTPFKTVTLLVGKEGWDTLPPSVNEALKKDALSKGKELQVLTVQNTAKGALSALKSDAEAVYVGPLLNMPEAEQKKLAAGLQERKIPSFSWLGEDGVHLGFLAGTTSREDGNRLARRFALSVQSLLLGEVPDSLRAVVGNSKRLFLNGPVATALNLVPNMQSLLDTQIIGGGMERAVGINSTSNLSFKSAIEMALKSSLSLAAVESGVRASREDTKSARAPLLPQLGLNVGARMIDADRARVGDAQGQANWGAQLHQTIFDERSWGSYSSSKSFLSAEESKRDSAQLDVVLDVASAYLDILRATTVIRIQKEDLSLSRENLDLSRVRQRVGQAGMEEVYRWESHIAQSRRDLLNSAATLAMAQVNLNTILNRAAETTIVPEKLTLESSGMLSSHPEFLKYMDDPKRLRHLLDFSVQEGLARAPELKAYTAQMKGVKRTVSAEKRSYFLPTVGLDAMFNHRFAATEEAAAPVPGFDFDEFDWEIGISATLPLFEGAAKNAAIGRGNAQYSQLSFEKQDVAKNIERQVRNSVYKAAASYGALALTRDAERAAEGNLKIVQDKYRRGRSTIIELLDAQNQGIVAQNEAADAVFVFLKHLMEVERATGRFDFMVSEKHHKDFIERLDQFSATQALGAR